MKIYNLSGYLIFYFHEPRRPGVLLRYIYKLLVLKRKECKRTGGASETVDMKCGCVKVNS